MGGTSGDKIGKRAKEVADTKKTLVSQPEAAAFALMRKRLETKGCDLKNIQLNGRQIVARKRISKGDVVLRVRLDCCLTSTDTIASSSFPITNRVLAQSATLTPAFRDHTILALRYLEDRENPDSFFAPYYSVLPQDLSLFPAFWDSERVSELQGSSVVPLINSLKQSLRRDYDAIVTAAPRFKSQFEFRDFARARVLVVSRVFSGPHNATDGPMLRVMAPFADMLDHREANRMTEWKVCPRERALVVTALKDIGTGDRIYCHYGRKSAKRFLLHYGFVPDAPDSPAFSHLHNREFVMYVPQDTPHAAKKRAKVNARYAMKKYSLTRTFWARESLEVMSFLRILCAKGADEMSFLPDMSPEHSLAENPIRPISARNELNALRTLQEMCKGCLGEYKKSSSGGDGTSEEDSIGSLCSAVVAGEVSVCRFYSSLADALLPWLESAVGESMLPLPPKGLGDTVAEYATYTWGSIMKRKEAMLNEGSKVTKRGRVGSAGFGDGREALLQPLLKRPKSS